MERFLNIMANIKLKIEKISIYLPKKKINNSCLDLKFKMKKGFFQRATGIKFRRISNKIETTEYMAFKATEKILEKNSYNFSHIISVTNTPNIIFPSLAHQVYSKFSKKIKKNSSCIGMNSGCSGYVEALNLASKLLNKKKLQKILIITSDNYSKNLDKSDRSVVPLFSDAATATIVSNSAGSLKINKSFNNTVPNTIDYLTFKKIKKKYLIKMNGPEVFVFVLRHVMPILSKIIEPNKNVTIFSHQASKIVLEKINFQIKKINPKAIIPTNFENIGNTVSSSLPILINQNWSIFKKSKNIVMAGFGVGLSYSFLQLKN